MKKLILCVFVLFTFFSCKKNQDSNLTLEASKIKQSFFANYDFLYKNHLLELYKLNNSVGDFYSYPVIYRFNDCRQNWINSFTSYQYILPFHYLAKESNTSLSYNINKVYTEGNDFGYLDVAASNNYSGGIIYDQLNYPTILPDSLDSWNYEGTSNICLGYQSLEFLLFGEDDEFLNGGSRQHYDFIATSTINNRRRSALYYISSLVTEEFSQLQLQNLKTDLTNVNGKDFIARYLQSAIKFIKEDLITRTLEKPFQSLEINDEICPQSDMSLEIIETKLLSIKSMIFGLSENSHFEVDQGYYLGDLILREAPSTYQKIEENIENAISESRNHQNNFDVMINDNYGRTRIQKMINSLEIVVLELSGFLQNNIH